MGLTFYLTNDTESIEPPKASVDLDEKILSFLCRNKEDISPIIDFLCSLDPYSSGEELFQSDIETLIQIGDYLDKTFSGIENVEIMRKLYNEGLNAIDVTNFGKELVRICSLSINDNIKLIYDGD